MVKIPLIEVNCPCYHCTYNLRGLRWDANCPECGTPVCFTLMRVPGEIAQDAWELWNEQRSVALAKIASVAGVSVDAATFYWDAWQDAHQKGLELSSAVDVGEGLRKYAVGYFNDAREAKELLTDWGLIRSEDVGRVVFACVDAGWIHAEPHESVRDFDGVFTLDDLLSRPWR